jgi:hypothetical protein
MKLKDMETMLNPLTMESVVINVMSQKLSQKE